ncbi:hypothetical protein [Pseudomonas sp. RC10]|uniref:hypothetical protein n=1 Tax=Pseudomonas bambusae TaxID=3139142 RepID=UPI00313966F4
MTLVDWQGEEEALVVSESSVYALLTYHSNREDRTLQRWITDEVVPCLQDEVRVAPASGSRVSLGGEWRFRCCDGDEMLIAQPLCTAPGVQRYP